MPDNQRFMGERGLFFVSVVPPLFNLSRVQMATALTIGYRQRKP